MSETFGKLVADAIKLKGGERLAAVINELESAQQPGLWLGPADDARAASTDTADKLAVWKDILKVGQYIDPKDNQPFAVTPELYQEIEAGVAAMNVAGDEPAILFDHHDGPREMAKNAAGNIKGLRRDGDWLQAKFRFSDEDALKIGLRNKVSVRVRPNQTLSNGTKVPLMLTHVALTPRPVLTNLRDWNLALSRGSESDVPETYFAAPTPTGEKKMTAEQLERVKKFIPAATVDTAIDLVLSHVETLVPKTQLDAVNLKLSNVETEVATLKANIPAEGLTLSASELGLRKRVVKAEVGEIVSKWPQVAKDAVQTYLAKGQRAGLMLSTTEGDRTELDDLSDMLRAIPLKGLTATGEQTGIQKEGITLSREIPDDTGDGKEKPMTLERKKELLATVGM